MLERRVPNRNTCTRAAVVGDRVQEVEQDLRVASHAAADVAEHDERRRTPHATAARDGQDFAALPQARADRAAQVGCRSARVGPQPPGSPQVEREGEAANLRLGLPDLGGAHRLEIHRLQALALAHRERGVGRRLLVRGGRPLARRRERLGRPAASGRGALAFLVLLRVGECLGHLLARAGRVAPEQGEGLVEHVLMLVPVDHRRAQRGPRLGAAAEIDESERLLRGDCLGRPDRQPRPSQQPREVHDIGGERARVPARIGFTAGVPIRLAPAKPLTLRTGYSPFILVELLARRTICTIGFRRMITGGKEVAESELLSIQLPAEVHARNRGRCRSSREIRGRISGRDRRALPF